MRHRTVPVVAVLLLLASCRQDASKTEGPWGDAPVPKSAADLEWTDLDPAGAPGVKIAKLWGDPSKGGSECVFFVESEGPFDLHLVSEDAPAPN